MFCPKCGKQIGNGDRFCRYCGANTKGGNNSQGNNINVNINKGGNPRPHKKGNVIGAIQYAYKCGALNGTDSRGYKYGSEVARCMTDYVLEHHLTTRYDIEQTIYQIVNLYKSGALNGTDSRGYKYGSEVARVKIWQILQSK